MSARQRRIGVYGGAFDPIHLGHLRCGLEVRQMLGLDELRFVPSGNPPHRSGARADAAHRLQMLELAIADATGVVIDSREVQNTGTSYSFDTLASIAADYPGSELTLIIGTDQFSVFDTWHRWEELLMHHRLAVMERPGESISDTARNIMQQTNAAAQDDRIVLIPVTQLQISSSRIRADLSSHKDIQFLVPQLVRDYIHANGLYTNETRQPAG
ncbi:MAG: nicotinate-nucleotide adenylyltransferase [Pseudomonadota bacterium]